MTSRSPAPPRKPKPRLPLPKTQSVGSSLNLKSGLDGGDPASSRMSEHPLSSTAPVPRVRKPRAMSMYGVGLHSGRASRSSPSLDRRSFTAIDSASTSGSKPVSNGTTSRAGVSASSAESVSSDSVRMLTSRPSDRDRRASVDYSEISTDLSPAARFASIVCGDANDKDSATCASQGQV